MSDEFAIITHFYLQDKNKSSVFTNPDDVMMQSTL